MQNKLAFTAAAAAILLAGALAAWTAARRVVEPPAGETLSAGELSVPTVFGQSAEEVLFYPWSLYDAQALYAIPEDSLAELFGESALQYAALQDAQPVKVSPENEPDSSNMTEFAITSISPAKSSLALFDNFSLIQPVTFRWVELLSALEWNAPSDGGASQSLLLYLKDLPASMYPEAGSVPVTLSFAYSASHRPSISFLIRPAMPSVPTEEDQAAAMEAVRTELRGLFLSPIFDSTALGTLLQSFLEFNSLMPGYRTAQHSCDLRALILQNLFGEVRRYYVSNQNTWVEFADWPEVLMDKSLPLDDFLAVIESIGALTVQLVSTQSQIVVLFTLEGGQVLGAYYDIQLGCWTGVGYME